MDYPFLGRELMLVGYFGLTQPQTQKLAPILQQFGGKFVISNFSLKLSACIVQKTLTN